MEGGKHGGGKSERRGRIGGKEGKEEERGRGIEESGVEWGVGEERMWGKKGCGGRKDMGVWQERKRVRMVGEGGGKKSGGLRVGRRCGRGCGMGCGRGRKR